MHLLETLFHLWRELGNIELDGWRKQSGYYSVAFASSSLGLKCNWLAKD